MTPTPSQIVLCCWGPMGGGWASMCDELGLCGLNPPCKCTVARLPARCYKWAQAGGQCYKWAQAGAMLQAGAGGGHLTAIECPPGALFLMAPIAAEPDGGCSVWRQKPQCQLVGGHLVPIGPRVVLAPIGTNAKAGCFSSSHALYFNTIRGRLSAGSSPLRNNVGCWARERHLPP